LPRANAGRHDGSGYNQRFNEFASRTMEAERLNAVANRIADLSSRGQDLRRYL
jgi:hypothetical protein